MNSEIREAKLATHDSVLTRSEERANESTARRKERAEKRKLKEEVQELRHYKKQFAKLHAQSSNLSITETKKPDTASDHSATEAKKPDAASKPAAAATKTTAEKKPAAKPAADPQAKPGGGDKGQLDEHVINNFLTDKGTLDEVWNHFDTNGDGKIDDKEFQALILKSLLYFIKLKDPKSTPPEPKVLQPYIDKLAVELKQYVDADGDGEIQKSEFQHYGAYLTTEFNKAQSELTRSQTLENLDAGSAEAYSKKPQDGGTAASPIKTS